jgi:hypothetical protein
VPGTGHDYQVGPNAGQLATLAQVPWNSLQAGDTVRIFWQATPYKEKFLVTGHGTAAAPIRVCGVKGPNGERPIVDGKNATTGSTINYGTQILNQSRNVVYVAGAAGNYYDNPEYIQIEGLEITGQYSTYSFTTNAGVVMPYDAANFGACLWIERGHHVVVRDNVIHDCTNGIFSKSLDPDLPGETFMQTMDLLLSHNTIYDAGVVGDVHEHSTYIQTIGVTYEYNHYGPLRAGAQGNSLKDRSVGPVVRYNYIEAGAHSMDFVEAQDYPNAALALPAYRTAYAYGNVIRNTGTSGVPIHYGGDHYGAPAGAMWGEPIFRKGTLYFFGNTMVLTDAGTLPVFDLSTTDEHAEIFNNAIIATQGQLVVRAEWGEVGNTAVVAGGNINLGVNWFTAGWVTNTASNTLPGSVLTGTANLLSGSTAPIDLTTFAPLAGSPLIDRAQAPIAAVASYPVDHEWNATTGDAVRPVNGAGPDLGAIEGN